MEIEDFSRMEYKLVYVYRAINNNKGDIAVYRSIRDLLRNMILILNLLI